MKKVVIALVALTYLNLAQGEVAKKEIYRAPEISDKKYSSDTELSTDSTQSEKTSFKVQTQTDKERSFASDGEKQKDGKVKFWKYENPGRSPGTPTN